MFTKKSHVIEDAICEKSDCKKSFKVIISPIYSVVASPVEEFDIKGFSSGKKIVQTGEIDDYIVSKCICGQVQRVYLKIK